MKNDINWRLFFVLLVAGVVSGFMVMPYVFALSPTLAHLFTPVVIATQIIQFFVIFSIAIFFGLYLGKRVGLRAPILEGLQKGEKKGDYLKSIFGVSVGAGVLAAGLIILFSFLYPALSLSLLKREAAIPVWKTFLASFYGGIAEEILMRLFFMTLLVWLFFKIKKTADGRPTAAGVWLGIVAASVIFGLGHLPITGDLTTITPAVVARAVLLNGVAGIIFGWLYWKKGLESAMLAHFSADIVLHVILPTVAARVMN